MKKKLLWLIVIVLLAGLGFGVFRFAFDLPTPVQPAQTTSLAGGLPTLHWLDDSTYDQQEIDELLTDWGKANGVNVYIEHIANNYDSALKTYLNAGKIPDIWINRAGVENGIYAEYTYDWTHDPILSQFDAMSVEQCKDGDVVTGLPGSYEAYGIVYNKRLFEKANITRVPQTLGELRQACAALSQAGYLPFYNGYKENWVLANIASQFVMPLPAGSPAATPAPRFSETLLGAQLFSYLDLTKRYGQPNPLESDWRDCAFALAKGEAAMTYIGNWSESTLKRINPYVDIGFMPLPINDQVKDAQMISTISGVWKLHRESPKLSQAKALLLHFLTSETAQGLSGASYSSLPLAAEGAESTVGTLSAEASRQMQAGKTRGWVQSSWPGGFDTKCAESLQSYLDDNRNATQTLDALDVCWEDLTKNPVTP